MLRELLENAPWRIRDDDAATGDRVQPETLRKFLPDMRVDPVRPARRREGPGPDRSAPLEHSDQKRRIEQPAEVSVVLGSYNRLPLLKLAIESARRELAGSNGEIVVIDGGSTDGSVDYLVAQDDVITIIQHNRFEKNGLNWRRKSWGAFMNIAFKTAVGRYLLMISDDCLLLPGSIESALNRIEAARQAGLRVGACAFYYRDWPEEPRYYVQRTLGGNLMVNHGIYMREALEAVDYINENDYVFYKADTDLSLRIWQAGYAVIDCPDAISEHFVGPNEKVRASNQHTWEIDRESMRRIWPDLTTGEATKKMGRIELERAPGSAADEAWRQIYDQMNA